MIPDWGGRHETFEVAILEPPQALVHTTQRGRTFGSWAIVLTPYDDSGTGDPRPAPPPALAGQAQAAGRDRR